jgi:hypothetical protein
MQFFIANTFTKSLARLTNDEQKAAKIAAFDLQMNPASPGMSFHRLDRARDKNFHSIRVTRDIRLIVHQKHECMVLCYVDHHDQAYQWAQCRAIVTDTKTGAAQLLELVDQPRSGPRFARRVNIGERPAYTPPPPPPPQFPPDEFAQIRTSAELAETLGMPTEEVGAIEADVKARHKPLTRLFLVQTAPNASRTVFGRRRNIPD